MKDWYSSICPRWGICH